MNRILAITCFLWATIPVCAIPDWPPASFSAYYGKIEADTPQALADFDLLIVHPGPPSKPNLDLAKIDKLRRTGRDKTVVGYISIGEDSDSPGGPPKAGQSHAGPSFIGKDLRPTVAQNDYPTYFMDQRRIHFDPRGFPLFGPSGKPIIDKGQDGQPDENGVWGSYYAKADDPVWQSKVFRELERLDQLGLDGFFLDTVDTASPWGDYGWTSAGMLNLIEEIRQRYPNKRIVANRGLFYMSQNDRYADLIDAVLFESLLTGYSRETQSANISPWARWHIQALLDDVIPAQRRTGVALLVLDYLNPEHQDATLLIQSARSLLQDTPHCLSFSHPNLDIPGWTAQQLLKPEAPPSWPSVEAIRLDHDQRGEFSLEVTFDATIPTGAIPDLRITTRSDVGAKRAAELPLTSLTSWKAQGTSLTLKGQGLSKDTEYRLFLRLISDSQASPSAFAWSSFKTSASELLAQVVGLSNQSLPEGVQLTFTPLTEPTARSYRVYKTSTEAPPSLWLETEAPPVMLPQVAVGEAVNLTVVAVDQDGKEGYPSLMHTAIRQDVTPPSAPSKVTVNGTAREAHFSWPAVSDTKSYRLYVVPDGQSFRLPVVVKETEITLGDIQKGRYRVFLTAVDAAGNQSQPSPALLWQAQ